MEGYLGGGLIAVFCLCWLWQIWQWLYAIRQHAKAKAIYGTKPATKAELEEKLNQFWANERQKYIVNGSLISSEKISNQLKSDWRQVVTTISYIAGRVWFPNTLGFKRPFKINYVVNQTIKFFTAFFFQMFVSRSMRGINLNEKFEHSFQSFRAFYVQQIISFKPKEEPERGIHGSAKWATEDELGPEYKSGGIPLGPKLYYSDSRHLLLCALTRTGKGRDVQIPALLEYPAPTIVIDPKGQLAAVTAERRRKMGHKVYIINPFNDMLHEECPAFDLPSDGFNPLATLNPKSPMLFDDVMSLAEALVIDTGSTDKHWVESARELMALYMTWVVRNEQPVTLGVADRNHKRPDLE